jgi:Flp pilus assembly protein TadG
VDGRLHTRGQSLVEFAVVLSLLILILLGVFDLGRVFYSYVVITNAAREGAYYGAMHPDDPAGIVARVKSEAQPFLDLMDADITISAASTDPGTPITVSVQHDFSLLTSGILLGGRVLQIHSGAEMVIY